VIFLGPDACFLLTKADNQYKLSAMTILQIQRRIEQVRRQLTDLGPLHPGTLTEQYNVCGTPGCHCKDPKDPRKHGPTTSSALAGAAGAPAVSSDRNK
jgi:hypothetical protein